MIAKRLVILTVLSAFIPVLTGCESPNPQYQVNVNRAFDQLAIKSIGVLEFDWEPPEMKLTPDISSAHIANAGAMVSDMVASELMKLGRYAIRERSDLKRVLEEHKLQLSDLVAKGDYRTIGKIAGVDAVVVGRVSMANIVAAMGAADVEVSYTCRCVDTQNGNVAWSMGGDNTVFWAITRPPGWLRMLTKELVRRLDGQLRNPPPSKGAGG